MDLSMIRWRAFCLAAALSLLDPRSTGAQGRYAEVNGVRVYYETQGSGPALVLIHGWAINSDYWDDQIPAFREKYRVIRYDRRGYGRSSGDPDLTADPVDLRELLALLGVQRAHLVGHSMGTTTALAFAVQYPQNVSAMVLTGAAGVSDYSPERAGGVQNAPAERRRIARTMGLDSLWAITLRNPPFTSDTITAEQHARSVRMLATYRATDLLQDTRPSGQTRRVVMADLPNVHVPTLFLLGERETRPTLEATAELARRIPKAKRILLPDAGHLVSLSKVAAYNAAVLQFLAEVDRPPAGRSF